MPGTEYVLLPGIRLHANRGRQLDRIQRPTQLGQNSVQAAFSFNARKRATSARFASGYGVRTSLMTFNASMN